MKFILIPALFLPLGLLASDLASEYDQVRKIAMRDPKVQSAYAAADRKLAERIVEIDPALKNYQPGTAAKVSATPSKARPTKQKSKPSGVPKVAKGRTHTVAKGETLSGIATAYRVSVASIQAANKITDQHRLNVGQTLKIPSGTPSHTPPPSSKPAPKTQSWWDRLGGE